MRLAGVLLLLGSAGALAGPPTGPDPKPSTEVEAKALETLAGGRYQVDRTQAFSVTLATVGRVQVGFACALDEKPRCKLVMGRGTELLQLLDDPLAREFTGWACEPAALSFTDVNGDGAVDLAVIFSCITGIGRTGAQPFPAAEVFIFKDGRFTTDRRIDQAIEASSPKTVKALVTVARGAAAKTSVRSGQ